MTDDKISTRRKRVPNGAKANETLETLAPKTIKVLGIDPAMSNFGLVLADLDPITGKIVGTPQVRLISTKGTKDKKTIRKSSDDLRRARDLYLPTTEWVELADLVCSEMPLGSQNSSAMKSVGMCLGLLASIQKPLIQVMPDEVKLASVGNKTASKADMIQWAVGQYPDVAWLTRNNKKGAPITLANEHIADAFGVIHAAAKTDNFKLMAMGFAR
jgi:Holliday junction resolvasome RuvABC endonuclease subunit